MTKHFAAIRARGKRADAGISLEFLSTGTAAQPERNAHDVKDSGFVGRALYKTLKAEFKGIHHDAGNGADLHAQQSQLFTVMAGKLVLSYVQDILSNSKFMHLCYHIADS